MFLIVNIILFILSIVSCQSTNIFFDIESQSIISCNQRSLKRLVIECDSTNVIDNDCIIQLYSKTAPSIVKLDSVVEIYEYKKTPIFYPNCSYKLTFIGGGDEGYTELKIWLDKKGKVYKTNRSDCD